MDRAQMFTTVTQRNALRREAGLPLLNVRAEMQHMETVAAWTAWNALYDEHSGIRERIRAEVTQDLRGQGRDLESVSARRTVAVMTDDRFQDFLSKLGHRRPPLPDKNRVVYGEAKA